MNTIAPLLLWCLIGIQDPEKKREEKIVASIPDFYLSKMSSKASGVEFNPCPEDVSRKYLVRLIDAYGKSVGEFQYSEELFYKFARDVIDYGVKDDYDFTFYLNDYFKKFIRLLFEKDIINRNGLKTLFNYYIDRTSYTSKGGWIESAYYLTEAVPDLLEPDDPIWKNLYEREQNSQHEIVYFKALCAIRAGADKQDLAALVYNMSFMISRHLQRNDVDLLQHDFKRYAKAYAVLVRNGLNTACPELRHEAELNLFKCYLHYNSKFLVSTEDIYGSAGLPLPDPEIFSYGIAYWLGNANDLSPDLISNIRKFGGKFPKNFAAVYRDKLLKNFGDFDDILYLIDCAGEDAKPELWKYYADSALDWHNWKENRITHKDSGDYYHIAVEAYRRAAKGGVRLFREILEKLWANADDLSVHMKDLIAAYELGGVEVRATKLILGKLEERTERYNALSRGANWNENGEIQWILNQYGQKEVPFREEVELAAYLDDPESTRKLSHKIALYYLNEIKKEGRKISPYYWDKQKLKLTLKFLELILNFDLDKTHSFYWEKYLKGKLKTSYGPAYVELAAIIDLYESLKFTDGARSLAQHLHGVGFKLPARRAFRIGGFEKEAEEQYFHYLEESYWLQQEEEFNYSTRKSALEK